MSFCSDIKDRISANENNCDFCNRAQLAAMVRYGGRLHEDKIVFTTENRNVANCAIELIHKNFGLRTGYFYKEKSRLYDIVVDDVSAVENICDALMMYGFEDESIIPFECCLNAYIKGAFLGGGSISNPHKSYHLEFDAKYQSEADRICELLNRLNIPSKITCRKKHYVVYIKEYSAIADVLGVIGDTNSAFDIYNISIEKDVRNNINRQMNCENANMDKIADAYKKHLLAIEKIKRTIGLDKLPDTLQEIAEVRVKYPEDGLKQLGERLENPIGKSGVNHRLNRIMSIADEIE